MTQIPAASKPKKPLWRRLLKWTLRTAVVLLALGIAAYAVTSYWAAKTINAEIARIRAAGEPLTFDDLDNLTPKVDRAQDAGPYYLAAAELINADFETGTDETHFNFFFGKCAVPAVVPDDAFAWSHRSIEQNHIPLDLLDRGSALPGCNADIQLQYGISTALTHLGRPRALLLAASLRSRSFSLEGHSEEAVDSIVSSIGLLRLFDRQPVLTDTLVQGAMLTEVSKDVAFVIGRGNLSDAALQRLSDALARAHFVRPEQMFIAERVYYLELMRNLIASGAQLDPPRPEAPLLPERQNYASLGLSGRVLIANCLPLYARYINAATGDWPGKLTAVKNVADNPANMWTKMAPSFASPIVFYGLSLAAQHSAQIAIEIERYRLNHNGQLPDSLSRLPDAASLPNDPFTGRPLLYVKTPDGYCVMSAGRDHSEDYSGHIDRDADPIAWSQRWGVHVRTTAPQLTA